MTDRARFLDLAFFACLAIFLVGTAPWLLIDGPNPDDWRQMAGAPAGGMPLNWTTEEGRWAMELIFVHLFGERFLTPIQAAIGFVLLAWVARFLAGRVTPGAQAGLSSVLIFAIGTNHIYMVDALNFSSHVAAYPAALALSLGAFAVIEPVHGRWWRIPLAVQMLAFSAGIYQPYAVFGAVLPLLAFMRAGQVNLGLALRNLALPAVVGVLGIALYVGEWRIAAAMSSHVPEVQRVTGAGMDQAMAKLTRLHALWRPMFTGSLIQVPFGLRLFNLGFLGLTGLVVAWAMVRRWRTDGALSALRLGSGAVAILFVMPALIWFGYGEDWMPGRVVGYLGLILPLVGLAALPALPAAMQRAGYAGLGIVVLVYLLVAASAWQDQAETGARDRELARAIMARVAALPGYDGGPVRLVGGRDYPDLAWGGLLGWTAFHEGNPAPGVFREMFGFGWTADSVFLSPRACPAFPAHDAVFLHEGRSHVCLSAFEAPMLPLAGCAPLQGDGPLEAACFDGRLLTLVRDCDAPTAGHIEAASGDQSVQFRSDYGETRIGDRCYKSLNAAPGYAGSVLELQGVKGDGSGWTMRADLPALN